jgi:hypothetical protein
MNRSVSSDSRDTNDTFPEVSFITDQLLNEPELPNYVTEFRKLEMEGILLPEPLLKEDKSRFVLFPIQYTDVIILFSIKIRIVDFNYSN